MQIILFIILGISVAFNVSLYKVAKELKQKYLSATSELRHYRANLGEEEC